jgi:hypothetical protein
MLEGVRAQGRLSDTCFASPGVSNGFCFGCRLGIAAAGSLQQSLIAASHQEHARRACRVAVYQ